MANSYNGCSRSSLHPMCNGRLRSLGPSNELKHWEQQILEIRRFTLDDWTRVCEIHDAARRIELASAGLDDAFLTMEQTAANEGFHEYNVLVAEIGGSVQGFVAFSDLELSWLYVHPSCHRTGVGSALVRAALLAARLPLSVEVLNGNERALALYRKLGFAVVGHANGRMPGNERFAVSVTELRYNGIV